MRVAVGIVLVLVMLALWWWILRELNKVPALEREVESLERTLRASRSTSHQLALTLGAAKRQHPELRLDVWAEVQADQALAEERKKAHERREREAAERASRLREVT